MNQAAPSIKVLGVYRVPFQEREILDQLRKYYFFGNAVKDLGHGVSRLIDTCVPLAMFEVALFDLDDRFRVSDFTQEMPATPSRHWQAAYCEALLSSDGSQVISRETKYTTDANTRLAFYFHYYDPSKPMKWTYGTFCCPPVQTVPERLWHLVPYSPVD